MIFRELELWWTPDSSLMMEGCPFIGYQQWWSGLGEAGSDNVIILPGVSLAEAQEFVDHLYGRDNILSVTDILQ